MANIRINALPSEASPVKADVLAIDGASTRKTTIEAAVLTGRPTASQAEAEAGTEPVKAMVPLTTKQAIVAQGAVLFATVTQGAKADSAVQPSLTISAGAGLTGGGTLAANRTLALNSASVASLVLADSAIQSADMVAYAAPIGRAVPVGGATTQVLVKLSNADNDVGWTAAGAGDVTQNGVQTLTNKTIKDDTFHIVDPSDVTKRVRVDAGNVAAGQTRVLTMPNADVTISAFATTFLDDATGANVWTTLGAASSIGGTGYFKLPDGIIVQYGVTVGTTDGSGNLFITFPTAFPNNSRVFLPIWGNGATGNQMCQPLPSGNLTGNGLIARVANTGAAVASTPIQINWLAVGN